MDYHIYLMCIMRSSINICLTEFNSIKLNWIYCPICPAITTSYWEYLDWQLAVLGCLGKREPGVFGLPSEFGLGWSRWSQHWRSCACHDCLYRPRVYSQTQTFEPCFSCYHCSSYLAEMTLSIIPFSLICFFTSRSRMLSLRKAVLPG